MSELLKSLQEFQQEVNTNENVHKLIKNWNPNFIIESSDTGEFYTLEVYDMRIKNILEGEVNSDHEIRIEGDDEILTAIFTGDLNPAEAVLNGELMVYGDQNDQLKLDAISLVIWGM